MADLSRFTSKQIWHGSDVSRLPQLLHAGVPVSLGTDDPGMFSTDLTHEYMLVVEEMGLHETVTEVGLGFEVGIAGSRLSTAQRQKLCLARALLNDPKEIAEAMRQVHGNEELRASLIHKSKAEIKRFSWEDSALKAWGVLENALL